MNNSLHLFVLSSYSFVFLQLVLLGDPFLRAQRTLNIIFYNGMAGPKGKGIASNSSIARHQIEGTKGRLCCEKDRRYLWETASDRSLLRYVVDWCILDV